jgi:cyclic beta-1,2-glucan synthetase
MALGQDITLEPYGKVRVAYLTIAARSRPELVALAERYKVWSVLDRAVEMARRANELALRQLDLGTYELSLMQQVLALLLYPHASLRASGEVLSANTKGQSSLWAYGISGDIQILLVRVGDISELSLVLELLRAHTYWRSQQVMVDLVILNLRDSSYSQELQGQLHRLIARSNSSRWLNQRGGIFVLNADQMGPSDCNLLQTAARVILDGHQGSVAEQLPDISARRISLPVFTPSLPYQALLEATPPLTRPTDLRFDSGWGGFSADGKEYVIYLEAGQWTPAPWVNVIANEHFGFLVSESGAGYTWAENSSENRLTPWRNDPVSDTPGEALYLRDEETAQVWSPMPLPSRDAEPYLIRHGAGYSHFEHHSQGLKQNAQLFAAADAPVKIIKLRLENTWNRPRRVTVTYYAEWVLGVRRNASQPYILPEYDHTSGALLARNPYNTEFGERVAFLVANKAPHGLTADRNEFLGRMGDVSHPAALSRIGLASTVEAGLDPCAAIQLHIDLPVGGSEEVFFLLGEGTNREHALQLIRTYQDPAQVESEWQAVNGFWDQILGTVSVQTPDPAMDLMLNRWLLYQALSCRIWGRSGFYQSSGAFGYRDQLQDVMALVLAAPAIARDHILRAAHYQFEAGDVLHWWHPPSGRGVRTRFSDDLLWLPFVVAHYVDATGDTAILEEKEPFLLGEPLKSDEEERYGHYETTRETYPLYEHCLRAIKRGSTAGTHGLPLIGTGDWNDGMNRIGRLGRGESVWVGWFLYSVLTKFAPLCEEMADADQAIAYQQHAERLKAMLETEAWDGHWYRRAYYDDGTPLGSTQNVECQIDSIAQSWSVLSGAGEPGHAAEAMSAVEERLMCSEDQLLLLFTPPFDKTPHDPGYIKAYPPGIRENGGQYTHAAIWSVWAFAQLGQGNLAGELFRLLNPILHSDTSDKARQYKVEPYVVAADVYSVTPHIGRGGWTWYTGSASWMYRLGIEAILGLKRKGNRLQIDPCIPDDWDGFELTYRDGETLYHIQVHNPQGVNRGVRHVQLDGNIISDDHIPLLQDGGQHEVDVELGVE